QSAAAAKPETGSAPAPSPAATHHAGLFPSRLLLEDRESRHPTTSTGKIHAGLPEGHQRSNPATCPGPPHGFYFCSRASRSYAFRLPPPLRHRPSRLVVIAPERC